MAATLLLEDGAALLLEDGALALIEEASVADVFLLENGDRLLLEDGGRLLLEAPDVYDIPDTIAYDGSVDVTDDLQAWFDSVPDGATARLKAGGVYNLEGTLLLEDRHDLTILGEGATLEAYTDGTGTSPVPGFEGNWPRWRARIIVRLGENVHISNIVLNGGHPNGGTSESAYNEFLEAQHGITFMEHTGGSFTNGEIYDVWGDFCYLDRAHDCTFADNHCRRNGRQGVAIVDGTGCWVTGNNLGDIRRSIFDLEANFSTNVIDDLHIEGNQTGDARLNWLSNGGSSWHVSNIHVANNSTFVECGGITVTTPTGVGGYRGPYYFEDNSWTVRGGTGPAFRFTRLDGLYFRDNTVALDPSRGQHVARLTDVNTAELGKNTVTGQALDYVVLTTL